MSLERQDRYENRLNKETLGFVAQEILCEVLQVSESSPSFNEAICNAFWVDLKNKTLEKQPAVVVAGLVYSYRFSHQRVGLDSSTRIERLPTELGYRFHPDSIIELNQGARILNGEVQKFESSIWYREYDPETTILQRIYDNTETGVSKTREFVASFAADIKAADAKIALGSLAASALVSGEEFSAD